MFAAFALVLAVATVQPVYHADFLISAGHEGRPASCARFPHRRCSLGTPGERAWTPIVADAATRILRGEGFTVAREPADFTGAFDVKAAVFIHFDGNDKPCSTGASIGYHTPADAAAAALWRRMYSHVFPFRFMPDNFTLNLRDYYGFHQVRARDGALVLEMGEMTCPVQRAWLAPRLQEQGAIVARFLRRLAEMK